MPKANSTGYILWTNIPKNPSFYQGDTARSQENMSYVLALIAVTAVVHYGYPRRIPNSRPVIPSITPISPNQQGSTVFLNESISPDDCTKPSFMNLTSCYWVNLSRQRSIFAYRSPIARYTEQFLCRENQLLGQNRNTTQATTQATRSRRATTKPILDNPCSTPQFANSVTVLMARDETGKSVELYHDIERRTFQTFYIRSCLENVNIPGYECATIETAFDAAVWIDDGDGDYTNDKVELKKVFIDTDCALHAKYI